MKFLIIDPYYAAFLTALYAEKAGLGREPYPIQWRILMEQCFGTADFYSANLKKLGHEAEEIVANCEPLQKQWATEHGLKLATALPFEPVIMRRRGLPIPAVRRSQRWQSEILAAQITAYRPDVLYLQDPAFFAQTGLLDTVRPYVRLIVGQHASALPPMSVFKGCDLILSSLPNQVEAFRQAGLKSEYFGLAFEPAVLEKLGPVELKYGVVHVGGYGGVHEERRKLLEAVSANIEVDFWGYGANKLPPTSLIRQRYHGAAWGLAMYQIRAASRMTLTNHSISAGPYANNMTLYETTGVGSLLVTDHKINLGQLFEPDKEVVAYRSPQECIEKIRYYLDHETERVALARAGQQRTLREHTYYHRMQQLLDILKRYLP